jgi:acetyltransferase-like isoleucine patch superfamily enzyme
MNNFMRIIFKNYSFGQALRSEFEEDLGFIVRYLPGILGCGLRYLVYKMLFKKIASIPFVYPGVRFVFMKEISLGKNVLVNTGSYVYGKGGIDIGDNVLISPNCCIVAGDHPRDLDQAIIEQSSRGQRIVICADSWIGANSVVLGGVTIGEGSVIGAGAVVTKDTEPYSINVGTPAKKVGGRKGLLSQGKV